jgi:hypothetical protein
MDGETTDGVDRMTCMARKKRHPRFPLRLILVAAACLLVVGGAVLLLTGSDEHEGARAPTTATTKQGADSTAPAQPGLVDQFSGSWDDTTHAFAAGANWEIRWQNPAGERFAIELLTKEGTSRGSVVDAGDRTEGVTFVVEGGEFKLRITAGGDWSIEVFSQASASSS